MGPTGQNGGNQLREGAGEPVQSGAQKRDVECEFPAGGFQLQPGLGDHGHDIAAELGLHQDPAQQKGGRRELPDGGQQGPQRDALLGQFRPETGSRRPVFFPEQVQRQGDPNGAQGLSGPEALPLRRAQGEFGVYSGAASTRQGLPRKGHFRKHAAQLVRALPLGLGPPAGHVHPRIRQRRQSRVHNQWKPAGQANRVLRVQLGEQGGAAGTTERVSGRNDSGNQLVRHRNEVPRRANGPATGEAFAGAILDFDVRSVGQEGLGSDRGADPTGSRCQREGLAGRNHLFEGDQAEPLEDDRAHEEVLGANRLFDG